MSTAIRILIVALMLPGVGCYHATVETGLTPSAETIDESWASGWILGLVPPSTISAQAKCKNGVARVETELSFLNQVVGMLTLGIYTPMAIKVTCAAGGSASGEVHEIDILLDENASSEQVSEAFMEAARIAAEEGRPVFVAY